MDEIPNVNDSKHLRDDIKRKLIEELPGVSHISMENIDQVIDIVIERIDRDFFHTHCD